MIDTMDCAEARITLGVYVLGALEPEERAALDVHLAVCEGCQAELADLESLPMLLGSVSEDNAACLADMRPDEQVALPGKAGTRTAPQSAGRPADLAAARVRRRSQRAGWLSAAAAAVIALAAVGGTELGTHLGRSDTSPYAGPASGAWQSTQGNNHAGMRATVRYRLMGWGTQVAVQVTGIPLHTPCVIEAFGQNGTAAVAGSWITDANEGHVWYPASAGLPEQSVTKFVITLAGNPSSAITIPL